MIDITYNTITAPGTPILVMHVVKGNSFSSIMRAGGDIDDPHYTWVAGFCSRDKSGEE